MNNANEKVPVGASFLTDVLGVRKLARRIFWGGWAGPWTRNLSGTRWARDAKTGRCLLSIRLEEKLLSGLVAIGTKPMWWLAVTHAFLQRYNGTLSLKNADKRIALFLCFPVFELHQFFFKFAYSLGERRLFLLTGERNSGGVHELCAHLGDCGNKLGVVRKLLGGFNKFPKGFGALNGGGNFKIHGETPNVEGKGLAAPVLAEATKMDSPLHRPKPLSASPA